MPEAEDDDRVWACVDANGIVTQVVLWDGEIYDPELNPRGWTPPAGHTLVEVFDEYHDGAEVGGPYDGERFYPNPNPTPNLPAPPRPPDMEQLVAVLVEKGVITAEDVAAALEPPLVQTPA